MNQAIKLCCLAIYLLAAISTQVLLPAVIAGPLQIAALVLVALHTVEVFVACKYLKRHPGPLVDSIALTLLFGLAHWMPLKKRGGDGL